MNESDVMFDNVTKLFENETGLESKLMKFCQKFCFFSFARKKIRLFANFVKKMQIFFSPKC